MPTRFLPQNWRWPGPAPGNGEGSADGGRSGCASLESRGDECDAAWPPASMRQCTPPVSAHSQILHAVTPCHSGEA